MEKRKQWVALTVVAVLAVLGAGWFLLVAPKHANAAALRQQAVEQQVTNHQLVNQLAVLRAQQKALPAELTKIAAVGVKIPPVLGEPELVRALTAAADTAGVEVVSVVPGALTAPTAAPTTGTVPAPGAAAPTTAVAASASSLPVTVVIAGGYFEAERYLVALEDMPRAFKVNAVGLLPGQAPGAKAGSLDDGQHLLTTITGVVFVAPAVTTVPAAAPSSTVPAAPVTK